jgi:hypothetical protein
MSAPRTVTTRAAATPRSRRSGRRGSEEPAAEVAVRARATDALARAAGRGRKKPVPAAADVEFFNPPPRPAPSSRVGPRSRILAPPYWMPPVDYVPPASKYAAVLGDMHFDLEEPAAVCAAVLCLTWLKPEVIGLIGDLADLGMLSRFDQPSDAQAHAIEQIRQLVVFANYMKKLARRVFIMEGNHDERWSKALMGSKAMFFDGAVGLSFREQCVGQGLDERVEWLSEAVGVGGVPVGQFVIRHAHNQTGRFGGGIHICRNYLVKNNGQSGIVGHHHKAQMFCQTANHETAVALACPGLTREQRYALGADWQQGFVILEMQAPDFKRATPHVVLIEKGRCSFGGRTFDGNAMLRPAR